MDVGYWSESEDGSEARTLTAAVSHALSLAYGRGPGDEPADIDVGGVGTAVDRALEYLSESPLPPSPYSLAMQAMTESNWGRVEDAEASLRELQSLRRESQWGSFWDNEEATPFHGWGLAGRIETTALALKALLRVPHAGGMSVWRESVPGGLSFVLGSKDQFGVWFSTRATTNALEALVAADEQIDQSNERGQESALGRT